MNGNILLATLKVGNAVRIPEWYSEVESCIDSRWLNKKEENFFRSMKFTISPLL